ncbi:TIR domain-containing protein [Paenibacillus sp. OAS669]|uniref:TIR domain-containing protein n=1 Tax=Paenibacillus sp. OAS669 TaxID=2663821 RepID=UPI00178AB6F6|nr:TIR domain-containing protein [Paenibacillus sp. OAS669]MBE1441213.1 putative nucleotide-binding protein [Paenibacillus sp. OAS669]
MSVSRQERKPELFIGSSREAIHYARAVHESLSRSAQVTPWYTAFGANSYTMEALEQQLDLSDFGVFVFAADDVALYRGQYVFITRDNTLFEMGLFWGKLRRSRVFALVPRSVQERDDLIRDTTIKDFHILSDLQGLTLLTYHEAVRGNYLAAVDIACGYIAKAIEDEQTFTDPCQLLAEKEAELERKQSILHFFWEYNRNVTAADPEEKYHSFSEAVRNSLLAPEGFRVTGAAIWKKEGNDGVRQVGGNVGRGKFYRFQTYAEKKNDKKIYVLEAFLNSTWEFLRRKEVAEVYVLCYPLDKEHVLSVHISGLKVLSKEDLTEIVHHNEELLATISHLVGGDSDEQKRRV